MISYWVGTAVGLLAMPLVTAGFIGAFGIFIIGAAISIGVGISLNLSDERYGWTESLQEKINELQESFNKKIEQIEEDVDNTIYKFFQDLEREFWNWVSANGGTTPYDYGMRY